MHSKYNVELFLENQILSYIYYKLFWSDIDNICQLSYTHNLCSFQTLIIHNF